MSAFSLLHTIPGEIGSLYPGARSNDPLIVDMPRKAAKGSSIFPYRSSRVE